MQAAEGTPFGADLAHLRARVRADRRATSAPLLVFGGLVVGYAVAGVLAGGLGAAGRHTTALLFWPVLTLVALVGLWLWARRRADRVGVGEGRPSYRAVAAGYLLTLVVVVVLFVPVLFVGVFLPLVWPATVLLAIGVWQRDRLLAALGAAVAVTGGLESVAVISRHGLPTGLLWLQTLVYAATGLALVVGGLVVRRRERAVR